MTARKISWAVMALLSVMVAGYALTNALVPGMRGGFVAQMFVDKPWRALGHLLLGGIALGAGAFQFSRSLRRRNLQLHRWLGRVYVVAVGASGVAALLLAPVTPGGPPSMFGFGMLAVLWLGSTGLAWREARAGRLRSHQEWMIRSYALCLAAVALRVYLPFGIMSVGFDAAYPAIAWLCWVPNLVIAEWLVIPATRRTAAV